MRRHPPDEQSPRRAPGLRRWIPAVVISCAINLGLFNLLVVLLASDEPVATDTGRLTVRLLPPPASPAPLKPSPEPEPAPKPQAVKSPPVNKPPAPRQVARAAKPAESQAREQVPALPQATAPIQPEAFAEPPPPVSGPAEVQAEIVPPPPPLAQRATQIVPLFRLTRKPKVVAIDKDRLDRFYPDQERDFGKEATVEAMILVDATGSVVEVEIIKSGGPRFDEAARQALMSDAFVFQPGYMGENPVTTRVTIPIDFHLSN